MNDRIAHVLYLGCSGFPYGFAEVERQKLIGKSLVNAGARVLVINRKGSHKNKQIKLPVEGNFEGIDYIYSSGITHRPDGFIERNWKKIVGHFNEFRIIYRENKKQKINAAIISTMSFNLLVYYFLLSRLFGFKIFLNYVEFRSKIKLRLIIRLNSFLFDKYGVYFADVVLPISNFLQEWTLKKSPQKQLFKIPSICDYEKFNLMRDGETKKYFLFCGSAIYYEVIEFIIDAFGLLPESDYRLKLIINGDPWQKDLIRSKINSSPKREIIEFESDLKYSQLVDYYINAKALLIPLRPTFQDIARFPHKIAEYTASKNPIITTNVGEIPFYFQDQSNALVAEHFDIKEFAGKMEFIIHNEKKSVEIGLNGYQTGQLYFNYNSYGKHLKEIIVG